MGQILRVYRVDDGNQSRLVRAPHPNTARGFVAQGIKVRVASQDDIADLVASGTKIELARPENAELPV